MLDEDNPTNSDETTVADAVIPGASPVDAPAGEAAPDGAPDATPDGAPAAKKTAARKSAKKSTAKKTAKKSAAKQEEPSGTDAGDDQTPAADVPADVPAEVAAEVAVEGAADATESPAERPTRRRAAKKAAPKPVAAESAESAEGVEDEDAEEAAAAAAPMVLFQAPEKPATTRKRAAKKTTKTADSDAGDGSVAADGDVPAGDVEAGDVEAAPAAKKTAKKAAKKTSKKKAESADENAPTDAPDDEAEGSDAEGADAAEGAEGADGDGEGGPRRRRRRGGRRRRRGGSDDSADSGEGSDDEPAAEDEDGDDSAAGSRRRRTRVRQPRNPEDEITSISGSTRLEAKKQRRREGREAGRRRAPIASEAEFLARREAVDRLMVIRQKDDLTQIGVLEDKVLVEHYASRDSQTSLIGNIYLGRVQNVLPSMEAAFIDIGKGRNAVLYAGEVNWSALGHKDGQPRKVESVLKSGQTILVQVTKDPVGHKGARLTGQISIPGRFLVYVPDGNTSGISRKLPDTERNRLKTVLKEIVPDSAGVIVRTAAEGATEDELTQDVERLKERWVEIEKKVTAGRSPELLYGEPDLTLKVVRDLFTEDFKSLVIEGDKAWELVDDYVGQVAPDLRDRLSRFEPGPDGKDVFGTYRLDEQIAKGLDRKVWLPSGGSLVIDRTEAMTVVDVNTGKFTGSGGNLEETVTKNNLEAAEEVVRQLRLRDIGGIIVIDFIDMVLESNRDLVLRRLVECLGRDRTRHQVAEVTSLGLVQMTRKRIGSGLIETFSEDCDHCKGRGIIVHEQPIEPSNRSVGMGGGMGGSSGGGGGGGDEPRGRRNRGGRGRSRNGDDAPATEPKAATPSPMALAGTKPHTEEELAEIAAAELVESQVDGTTAETRVDAPVEAPVDAPVESQVESQVESPGESTGSAVEDVVDDVVVEPKGADEPAEQAPEQAEPVAETAPEPVAAPVVVTSTRRRRAGRPAGAPAAAPAPEPVPAAEPVAAEAPESADSAEGAEGTDDEQAVFHVPVKKRGSRKR